ncbi:MAG: diguanylate cyclase [Phototrophicales bacterium]|nr:MAG: diguanylate cyclase [Phototrophicales bacterium]RMG77275.1 MAG: response regulator [Chloroflexota bacterium]
MAQKRLLLIEDDYDVAEMLLMYFQSQDYEVLHADNGTQGVELARTKFPNLILLDVMLPDMDGYDVCIKLRRMALTKFIPILFLTQRDERASKVRGLEIGADDYITKPFDIDELRLRVQGSIKRATRENLHEARTGLPTGELVEEEIIRKQASDEAVTELVYVIEGFKAYQDVYGFVAANDVLSYGASLLQRIIGEHGTPNDFVGIRGDDFIVLTHVEDVEALDEKIKTRFAEEARAFYSFIDVDQGGVILNPGKDNEQLVPLMTFSSTKRVASTE